MNPESQDLEHIEDTAAEWVVRRDAGLSRHDQEAFESWLAADPRHFAVFAEMQAALAVLDTPRASGQQDGVIAALPPVRQNTRWRRSAGWLGFFAAAIALVFTVPQLSFFKTEPSPSLATVILAPERRVLPDGSTVELNANSEIAVDYTENRRDVRLLRGEALFDVAKNPARPFIVSAGPVEVRAVGTSFVVRRDSANIDVLVTEGRVAVASTLASEVNTVEPVMVTAGARVAVPANGEFTLTPRVETMSASDRAAALAWRGMRFEFTNTSLAEAIRLFNHKSRAQLTLADPDLADLRVSGIYWADDPQSLARLLESSFDIDVVTTSADRIVLHRRR